jgi:hypothetical protein
VISLTSSVQSLQGDDDATVHQTVRLLRVLAHPALVLEIRALGAGPKLLTFFGFFNDPVAAAAAALQFDVGFKPRGLYVTANPLWHELLNRVNGRLEYAGRGVTATDRDVYRRCRLLLDFDPVRSNGVTGIPATDAEHAAALSRANEVVDDLWCTFGWRAPIAVDSGNGAQALYPISLPNDDDSANLLKRVLSAISAKWSDDAVQIDTSVSNAARLIRLPGTMNRKGDPNPLRPHRMCQLLSLPEDIEFGFWFERVSREQLEAVANASERSASRKPSRTRDAQRHADPSTPHAESSCGGQLDVERWLTDCECEFHEAKELADGWKCWQIVCPFNADHKFDAAVLQAADGSLVFNCFHNSCRDKTWPEARDKIGRPLPKHYSGDRLVSEAYNDPHRLARSFRRKHHMLETGDNTLVFWRDEWHRWNGVAWIKQANVEQEVVASIKDDFDNEPQDETSVGGELRRLGAVQK